MEQLSVNKVERNTGLDLLRVLCMFGIVLIHAAGFGKYGGFNGDPANRYVRGFGNMLAVAVDIFAFTSGWFGVKFSFKKFINLIGLSIICGIISYFFCYKYLHCVEWNLWLLINFCTSNWYFTGYLVLMLLSPLLNAGIDKINKDNIKQFLIPLILLSLWHYFSSLVPENHISALRASWFSRFSCFTIILIYIYGRLIRKTEILNNVKTWKLCAGAIILAIPSFSKVFCLYTSPLLIIEACFIFEIFRRLKLPVWAGKICVFLSPSMFSILLLHRSVEECKAAFMLLQDRLLNGINPFISVFVSAVIFFNICLVIDLIRRLLKYLGLKLLFTKRNKQGN